MTMSSTTPAAIAVAGDRDAFQRASISVSRRPTNSPGSGARHGDSEKVLQLRAGNDQRDAVGEADDHRPWDEPHCRTGAGDAHDHEQDAGHHRAHEQAVDAMGGDDAGHHDDKGTRRTANLHVRAAERGDDEPGDDRAVDAGLRRHAGRDGKGHRQRQRHQADGDPGDQVGDERARGVGPGARERCGSPALNA